MQYEEFNCAVHVSRETFAQLTHYVALLQKWQGAINLISRDEVEIWQRHIIDSAQLSHGMTGLANGEEIIDIGSGGGLPGIVVAIMNPEKKVSLVESDRRKTVFLREVVRQLAMTNTSIHCQRIEESQEKADVLTARALADVKTLLKYAMQLLRKDGYCLFLKGKNWSKEIEEAQSDFVFQYETIPSATSEEGMILRINNIQLRETTGI